MALDSAIFLAFVCAVGLVCILIPARLRYLWLLVCSYGLYIWACRGLPLQMPNFLANLGFGTVLPAWVPPLATLVSITLATWLCGLIIGKCPVKSLRILFAMLGVIACVGLWLACRHMGVLSVFRLHVGGISTGESATGFASIAVPLGLSYYTVQAAGYVVDVYAGRAKTEHNPLRYALFVSFFPSIFMGPTARAAHLLPQLTHPVPFSYNRTSGGIFRILWGFTKKLVVADNIAIFTTFVLKGAAYHPAPLLVGAILLFTLQLYMDFSGCCDIVLGVARLLGIDYAENFMKPFSALSFAALWRRWFVSLSGLLRDTILTPLTNNSLTQRHPALKKTALAVGGMATYTILGAWHGFEIDWLLWGLCTGFLVAVSLLFDGVRDKIANAVPLYRRPIVRNFLRRVMVYLIFSASLTLFISAFFRQPFSQWAGGLGQNWALLFSDQLLPTFAGAGLSLKRIFIIGGGLLVVVTLEHFAINYESTVSDWIRTQRFYVRWPLYYLLLAALLLFGVFPASEGIYQNF